MQVRLLLHETDLTVTANDPVIAAVARSLYVRFVYSGRHGCGILSMIEIADSALGRLLAKAQEFNQSLGPRQLSGTQIDMPAPESRKGLGVMQLVDTCLECLRGLDVDGTGRTKDADDCAARSMQGL